MQQNMTEEELELLKQIQEDLNLVKQEYGCTVDRKKLLTELLERNEHPVRPEEAELFFSGVLPSGWRNCYFREPKMLSASMVKLRKAISVQWCKDYLEPELRGLQGSESLRDCVISMSQMKKDLNLPLRKENMLSSLKQVESYLKEMRSKAGFPPCFRYIPPTRFAAIVDIYLEAMEERGDCTQEELGRLLGITQSAVSKLRKVQEYISKEKEFRVLLGLLVLHIKDDMLNQQDKQNMLSHCTDFRMDLLKLKENRWIAAVYLAVLLGFSVCYRNHSDLRSLQPATVADLNHFMKEHGFNEQFDPDAEDAFCAKPYQPPKEIIVIESFDPTDPDPFWAAHPKKIRHSLKESTFIKQSALAADTENEETEDEEEREEPETSCAEVSKKGSHKAIPLWRLIRLQDYAFPFEVDCFLQKIMQMDPEYLKLLYRMPDLFFTDLLPLTYKMKRYLEEMRQLRWSGLKCLMSKMETITISWELLSLDSSTARTISVYLKDYFQLMEYLFDNRSSNERQQFVSCISAVYHRRTHEKVKPLTDPQKHEYRMLFEKYISSMHCPVELLTKRLLELIRLKFSMNMQEWYFWLKMGLLWHSKKKIENGQTKGEYWHTFMEQCMDEAHCADRDESGTAPDT